MTEPAQKPTALGDYNAHAARHAAENLTPEEPSSLDRLKAAFRSWFTGESQVAPVAGEPTAHSAQEARRAGLSRYTSSGTTFVMPAEKKPAACELSYYTDVVAGIKDGPKFRYCDSEEVSSKISPASELKPYQARR